MIFAAPTNNRKVPAGGQWLLRRREATGGAFQAKSIPWPTDKIRVGTKFIVESCGRIVRRYIEFPDGRRVRLSNRMP